MTTQIYMVTEAKENRTIGLTGSDNGQLNFNKKERIARTNNRTGMLRHRRQHHQSQIAGANNVAAAASFNYDFAALTSSSQMYVSCTQLCAEHVRRCNRMCIGFSIQTRGFCRRHCKARALACPKECATWR